MNAPLILERPLRDVDETSLISIAEIFGPTIQGEGALIGMPTLFVRTGGCDYRCAWCDTGYAVLPQFEDQWNLMDASAIFKKIETLSQGHPLWVTLSGGNPALQDFSELIQRGQQKGYQFSMETQASIAKPWFSLLDQLTLSPKPPSTGMRFKQRGLERCLDACASDRTHPVDISLKFVVADKADIIWAKAIADLHPHIPSFIQPCNTDASLEGNKTQQTLADNRDQQRLLWLIECTQALHWHQVRILPQLHRWLWGDQVGV
ncbi:MAG: 7-carboxy-7-deazaguanine synthase QueE [Cocleimonas sp.]|nr:7-carboxy-7-deazaguanine synthase QueE [Cocleimonas sp.]